MFSFSQDSQDTGSKNPLESPELIPGFRGEDFLLKRFFGKIKDSLIIQTMIALYRTIQSTAIKVVHFSGG